MKKFVCLLMGMALLFSCAKQDDLDALKSKVDDIQSQVNELKARCDALNQSIVSLQAIVQALQEHDYVKAVIPIVKDGEEIGYTLSFSKGRIVNIYHGIDGKNPVVGVKKGPDGLMYWTIDGEWLLDGTGKRIRAVGVDGQDAITPQLKIDEEYWYVSYNNGSTWTRLDKAVGEDGKDGDSFFRTVNVTDTEVIITLTDGTSFTLSRQAGLDIRFDFEGSLVEMMNGQTIEVGYTLINASDKALVTVSSDGTYKLKVIKTDAKTGRIQISSGPSDNTGYVNVLVIDNGYTIGKVIDLSNFEVFFTLPSGNTYTVDHTGGNLSIPFETNLKREVSIYSGDLWLSVAPETKAVESGYINITVKPNAGEMRKGKVKINTSLNGEIIESYLVDVVQLKIDGIPDLSADGTANCYIVSSSGAFKFKAVKGNSNESVGAVSTAEVLWESFGTDTAPQVGDLVKNVSYLSNGYIKFEASALYKKGNALIAAKDATGKILWSWHIWLTDIPEDQVYYNDAGTMMDRNLGATSATPGDVGALGLFYQWGRKDPFLGSSNIKSSVTAKSTGYWPTSVASDATKGTIQYAIEHPTTFIKSSGNWQYNGSDKLWLLAKTIYDPCPPEYRVPESIWAIALDRMDTFLHSANLTFLGMNFGSKLGKDASIWYPFTGHLSVSSGLLGSVGYDADYMTVDSSWSGPVRFTIDSYDYVNPDNYGYGSFCFGYGHPVRCCKE